MAFPPVALPRSPLYVVLKAVQEAPPRRLVRQHLSGAVGVGTRVRREDEARDALEAAF